MTSTGILSGNIKEQNIIVMQRLSDIVTFLFLFGLFFSRPEYLFVFYSFSAIFFLNYLFEVFFIGEFKKTESRFFTKGFTLFVVFCGLSYFWAIDKVLAAQMAFRVLVILFILKIIFKNSLGREKYNIYLYSLMTGIIINFLLLAIPSTKVMFSFMGRFSGTFENPNSLAVACIVFVYFLLRNRYRFSPWTIVFLLLITEILILSTASRKGLVFGNMMIILNFGVVLRRIVNKYNILIIVSAILLGFLFLYVNKSQIDTFERFSGLVNLVTGGNIDSSTKWRIFFIDKAYEVFKDNFFLGVGIDNFQKFTGVGLYAHNNYMELLADLGIIGFLIYYRIFYLLFRHLRNIRATNQEYIFLIVLLIMDIGIVSYYSRFTWIALGFFLISNPEAVIVKQPRLAKVKSF